MFWDNEWTGFPRPFRRDHGVVSQRPSPILRLVLRAPRALYRRHLGWLLGRRFLLLDHVGRNSGSHHQTVLEVIHYDPSSGAAVVMSGWGTRSDWYRNIQAAGGAKITVGRETMSVNSRVLEDPEAVKVLVDYERRNRLITPIVRRVLSQLAEFKYDGTESSRLALVQQLPLVEFTPSSSTGAP